MDIEEEVENNEEEVENNDDEEEEENEPIKDSQENVDSIGNGDTSQCEEKKLPKAVRRTGGHRAGYDAFMTGLAFASFIAKYGKYGDIATGDKLLGLGLEEFYNKVALSGKDIPLQIAKSAFSKTSKEHRDKIQRIRMPTRTDVEMQK